MKLTNGTILDIINTLSKFKNQSGLMGYMIAKNLRMLRAEIADCEKFKDELVDKYGKENEDGAKYISEENPETLQKFLNEFLPVLNCEVDINFYQMDKDKFNFDYEEEATVKDYEVLEAVLCKAE